MEGMERREDEDEGSHIIPSNVIASQSISQSRTVEVAVAGIIHGSSPYMTA